MNRDGHNAALLFEITIVLLFFALSATVILGMFLSAHDFSKRGRTLNQAVIVAQDWAETVRGAASPEDYLTGAGFERAEDGYRIDAESGLSVRISLDEQETGTGRLFTGEVSVGGADDSSVSLPLSWYVPTGTEKEGA